MLDKKRICILILVLFAFNASIASANDVATIHGAVYDWDSFSLLENSIVEVNSTPSQSMLANYGVYSFNLPPGNYLISASYYSNYTMVSYAEEEVTISDNGDYVLDLILLPTYLDDFNDTEFSELEEIASYGEDETNTWWYVLILFFVSILLMAAHFYMKRQNSDTGSPSENLAETITNNESPSLDDADLVVSAEGNDTYASLPDDLQAMLKIIELSEGRITQKELRSKVKYSEAKVSLMVSDLEDRGLVHKFKKGRGNVIVLEGYE